MTRDKKATYLLSIILTLLLTLSLFVRGNGARFSAAVILLVGALVASRLLAKRVILSIYKNQVLLITAVTAVTYITLYYISGLAFGFYFAEEPLSPVSVYTYIIPIAVIIISTEIIRHSLLSQSVKGSGLLAYLVSVLAEMLIYTSLSASMVFQGFLDLVGLVLLPALIANFVHNHMSVRYGIWPSVAYRLVTVLYSYFIWFVPATPDALYALSRLLVPLFLLWFVSLLYEKRQGTASRRSGVLSYVSTLLAVVIMISSVMLISCRFKYGVIVIATESMTGSINKGDAVIYETYDGEPISEGEVVIFDSDGDAVVHRVVKIERINGECRYYTKGDANDSLDSGYITDTDIIGTVAVLVPYLGYPSVWINEAFKQK